MYAEEEKEEKETASLEEEINLLKNGADGPWKRQHLEDVLVTNLSEDTEEDDLPF